MRVNVLLFSWDQPAIGRCAELALRERAGDTVERVVCVSSLADVEALASRDYDVVIALGASSRDRLAVEARGGGDAGLSRLLFAGIPSHLYWPMPAGQPEPGVLRAALDPFARDFVESGYGRALAGQQARLRQVVDLIQDGVMAHDENRRIYLFNREAERITGMRREDVVGRDCHDVFTGGLCGGECGFCPSGGRCSERGEYQVKFVGKDGVERRLAVRATPLLMGDEGLRGIVATFRDVTELSDLRQKLDRKRSFHGMVGQSKAMRVVFDTVRDVAISDYSVLVTGESGTGKELVAGAIHNESRRRGGPFVPVNCGALPENILESELFGHVKGAFTGAIRDKKGRFELAHGGTIFLDEVGELTPAFQVRLLRVLQERRFEPVGGEKTINVDVRVIAATNRDLRQLVREGKFRQDLYYRLAVVPIQLPPLRGRRDDIPLIAERIMGDIRQESGKSILRIADDAMDLMMGYGWPGNVRELINSLQYATVRCGGEDIEARHLPLEIREASGTPVVDVDEDGDDADLGDVDSDDDAAGRQVKLSRDMVERALAGAGGSKVKAARILGVGRATLYRFLTKHGMV